MGDFTDTQKYLTIVKARKATIGESLSNSPPFDKYYGRSRSRVIKRVPTTLTIPAFYYTNNALFSNKYPRLLFQWNVALSKSFYITNIVAPNGYPFADDSASAGIFSGIRSGSLFVKYRVGATVYRYKFKGGITRGVANGPLHFDAYYTNQPIKANFCFEYWVAGSGFFGQYGLIYPLKVTTSLLNIPSTPDETEQNIVLGDPYELAALGNTLPEALPVAQTNLAFTSN